MKKVIASILTSTLLLTALNGCVQVSEHIPENTVESTTESMIEKAETGDIESEYDTANTEKSPMKSENETNDSDDTDEAITVEMYKEALYGFMSRHTPNEFIDWKLSKDDRYLDHLSFAILDMNGDDFPELVVNYLGEHAVLSYITGEKYLYGGYYGIRAMFCIKKDGHFYWTRSAGHEYGAAKFEKGHYVVLYRVLDNGIDDAEFFIGDQKVTEEELDTFIAQLCNEPADFYDLTEENIEKYVTLEIFNHK